MTSIVTIKLTVSELALLDWFVSAGVWSRSQAVRAILMQTALLADAPQELIERARDERQEHRIRRRKQIALCELDIFDTSDN